MKKSLIPFALIVVLVSTACSADPALRADAAYGVRYAEEQVVELPRDQGKFYLTVFGNEGEPRYEQVKSWIANDPQLKAVKAQTIYNTYRADSVMYRERYAQGISGIPCVRLQAPQGQVVYEAAGANVPMSAEALYNGIADECRRRHCRPQPPHVTPTPPVSPQPPVTPTPVTPTPAPVVRPSDFPRPAVWAGLVALGLAIGGGVAVASNLKKQFKGK